MRKILIISVLLLVAMVALAATIVGSNGTFTTSVSGTTITTTYTPTAGAPTCNSVYMVQTCKDTDEEGNVIKPKDYVGGVFKHLQDDMTSGGTYVDHLACEKDPYYNGEDEDKDTKSEGSDGASSSTPTTMSDTPSYSDGIYPTGVSTITSTFEVCAVCKDDGRILDCYTWTYIRTKGSAGTVTSGTTISTPSQEFKDAKKKFEKNHKDGTVCPDVVAETNIGTGNVASGGGKKDPENPQPEQPFLVNWDIVNLGGVPVHNVTYEVWLDGNFLSGGMVPEIMDFDFQTVPMEIPGLPLGPHHLMVVLDPLNEIPEYDEDDNIDLMEFEITEASAAPIEDGRGLSLQMLKPNPTHGEFQVLLRLATESPARLSVYDVRGRVVQTRAIDGQTGLMRSETFRLDPKLGAGVYFLRLEQDGRLETRKFIMLR